MRTVRKKQIFCHPGAASQYKIALKYQNRIEKFHDEHYANLLSCHCFSFIQDSEKLYFFNDFSEILFLNKSFESRVKLDLLYSTVKALNVVQIEACAWYSLFQFIRTYRKFYNVAAAFDEIEKTISEEACFALFAKKKLSKHKYLSIVDVSETSFIKQQRSHKKKCSRIITADSLRR